MTSVIKVDTIQNASGTDALTISSDGVAKKSQFFSYTLVGNQNNYAAGVTASGIANVAPFNLIKQSEGSTSSWDQANYRFVAPYDGTFLVSFHFLWQTNGVCEAQIHINGVQNYRIYSADDRGIYHTMPLNLSQGDYVHLTSTQSLYLHSTSSYSSLSYTLLN